MGSDSWDPGDPKFFLERSKIGNGNFTRFFREREFLVIHIALLVISLI